MLPDLNTVAARFAADLVALTGVLGTARIGLGVSGGADSVAMLLLVTAAFPGSFEVATVDHGLRAESAGEAAFVASLCIARGIPHATLPVIVPHFGNVSSAAREARYAALENWRVERGLDWIATAHHADDQVETLVMRLNRASGLSGLAAIRAVNGRVVRPLLQWTRAELVAVVADCGIQPIDDPTNRDDRFDRARLRKMLAAGQIFEPGAVARSVAALAEANDALDWVAGAQFARLSKVDDRIDFDASDSPVEIVRRVVLRCIAALDPVVQPRGSVLTRILDLDIGEKLTVGEVTVALRAARLCYRFSRSTPRRPAPPTTILPATA